jgi:ribonuclease HI
MDYLVAFTDGASRGNPGEAACAFLVKGITKQPKVFYLGKTTNNFAEYQAIIKLLEFIKEEKIENKKLKVVSDSKLVVNQINKKFKVKNKKLRALLLKVENLKEDLKQNGVEVEFENKSREEEGIKIVDKQLNKFLDEINKNKKKKQNKLATTELFQQ